MSTASRSLGLPIAVGGFMIGIVLAVNPERFGTAVASVGLVAGLLAAGLAVRLFRSGRPRPAAGTADNPDGSGNR